MNFFSYKRVAERYAKHRPYFHPLVIAKIKAYLQLPQAVDFAVDVGCGSGQSTVALKAISNRVLGMDISVDMLHVAEKRPGILYVQATAERLAVQSNSCELLTTFLAYHWFDREPFFAEARRLLKEGGWLIISNNGFAGQMKEQPAFEQWALDVYENRYPAPARNEAPLSRALAQQLGFDFAHSEEYQNEVLFTADELAAYLSTQSNVIAATEQGSETVANVHDWIVTQTGPYFPAERATFLFRGFIWYLQKIS